MKFYIQSCATLIYLFFLFKFILLIKRSNGIVSYEWLVNGRNYIKKKNNGYVVTIKSTTPLIEHLARILTKYIYIAESSIYEFSTLKIIF